MRKNQHSQEFKEQVLLKTRARGESTLADIAIANNLALGTLKGWIKQSNQVAHALTQPLPATPADLPATQYTAAQRLQALQESYALTGIALSAWCREKGLFEHQLQQWRQTICSMDNRGGRYPVNIAREEQKEVRKLLHERDQLKREVHRKDRALAEAAALLVLQKKFRALWADEAK